jgi:hypothetical protein
VLIFSKNCPKFTFISSKFGLLFDIKLPNFDQIFLWAKVLNYKGSILGDIWAKLGALFFAKRLVTLEAGQTKKSAKEIISSSKVRIAGFDSRATTFSLFTVTWERC